MKLMLQHNDKFVGVFILIGILFLVGAVAFVGVSKRWFQNDLEYLSTFETAKGLSPGLTLEFRGFAIGRVKSLELDESGRVQAVLSVQPEYADRIVADSVVELAVQPLGFGANLLLYPGLGGGEPLPPGSTIPSTDMAYGQRLLLEGRVDRPKGRDEIAALIQSLPPLLDHMTTLATDLDHLLVGLDERLMGDADRPGTGLLSTANGTVREFGDLAGSFNDLTAQLDRILASLALLAGQLEDPRGLVPRLIGPDGSAAALFQDNGALFHDLRETMDQLQEMMIFLNESTPAISLLMEETTNALTESEQVMQGLKNNPLLRGGIPPRDEESAVHGGFREGGK